MREPSGRNTVRRLAERANYDADIINDIIDEALICHVGIADESQPFVIPTLHARDGDYELPIWAGYIPLELRASPPADDPGLTQDVSASVYAHGYRRGRG